MPNQPDIKEKIISTTISLIQQSEGLIENITMRDIAQKADIAVGLINYHFGSKNNLIEICVQRIISHIMKIFPTRKRSTDTQESDGRNGADDNAAFIASVFRFLLDHPEISRISILGDLSQPNAKSNSAISYRAILRAMPDKDPEKIRKIKAFMLLSTIQSAFLNRQISEELLGIDLNNESDYRDFFCLVTEILNITEQTTKES